MNILEFLCWKWMFAGKCSRFDEQTASLQAAKNPMNNPAASCGVSGRVDKTPEACIRRLPGGFALRA